MEWLSAENIVAVGTAAVGIAASAVMIWYERRVPRRKRVGYRVQMDNPIGDDVQTGRANVRLGLFDEAPGMHRATLVLLRIENDGSQAIAHEDYTSRELHGLTVEFTDRAIHGVSVTQPSGIDHLVSHFTPHAGFGYDVGGNTLRIPRVPLNRGEHFKLLVLLSGGDVGCDIRLKVAATRGAIGYSELGQAILRRTVTRVPLDGDGADVNAIEYAEACRWGVEYTYAYGDLSAAASLAGSFLNYVENRRQQPSNGRRPCTL